ncbi:hypothetical protein F5J12DRAFT_916321, partial [Pisolithus orientalis]|uniref:uncharacterized protein n=1 Tax=Pisolithus orientalis TaxID=936130 RepID=UPI0022248283
MATRLLRKGFRSEQARTSAEDYYRPQNSQGPSSDKWQWPTKCFPVTSTHDSLTTDMQGSVELLEYMECEQVPMMVSMSHAQPQSPSEKTRSKGPSPGNLDEMAEMPGFETKEFSLSTNERLTMELQEAAKLEQVKPVVVEEPLMTKLPFEFETSDGARRSFSFCSHRNSQLAADTFELRYRSLKEDTIEAPSVSKEVQQLVDELLVSKIPLEFEAERFEEQTKPTRVKVEELEMLAGSPEAKRLADEEVVDSHGMLQCTNRTKSKVIARRKPPEEILQVEMLKHAARVDDLALEMFCGRAVSAIYILFR